MPDGEAAQRRWLRMVRWVRPRLLEDEARWWRQVREYDHLHARLGVLLTEVERARDRG